MAVIAKSGTPSLCTQIPPASSQLTKPAATDMAAGDLVYIKSDDTFALADGTAADAKALYWGMINRDCKAGQPVTAYHGVEFRYGAGLTPSARGYVATTAGGLVDAATTGGTVPAVIVTGATTVFVISPNR